MQVQEGVNYIIDHAEVEVVFIQDKKVKEVRNKYLILPFFIKSYIPQDQFHKHLMVPNGKKKYFTPLILIISNLIYDY